MQSTRISALISLAVLTSFGSSLTAIGTFLALGRTFHDAKLLALALAVKTLSAVMITRFTRKYALKNSVYRTMIVSQLSGVPLLILMAIGFSSLNPGLILIGIFLSGFSGNLLSLVFVPIIKELAVEEDLFKKWQGIQQTCLGVGSLIAGFISPWLLDFGGVNALYLIDGSTFVIAGYFLFKESAWYLDRFKARVMVPEVQAKGTVKITDSAEKKALLFIVPSFIFTGLIPIVASSGMQGLFLQPLEWVERLWMAEAASNVIIGWAYFKVKWLRTGKLTLMIPLFCTLPLIAIFLSPNTFVFYGAFLSYSILYLYGFTRYRDDLFSQAAHLNERINHSAFHLFLINTLRTLSAPLVSVLISYEASQMGFLPLRGLISIQLALGLCAVFYLSYKPGTLEVIK
ncbi:MAG: hypothetical protein H7069_13070 [Phormidesmis sp. FL-bin-119]|nr:hypothetical protein [Pedobacter sp.]